MVKALIGVLGAFLCINLLLGLYKGRSVYTLSNYFLANHNISTGTLLFSTVATIVGVSYVTRSFSAGSHGWLHSFIVYDVSRVCTALLAGLYIYPKLTSFKGCYTLGDIVGHTYGPYSQFFIGVISIIFSLFFFSAQLVAVYKIKELLGIGTTGAYALVFTIGFFIVLYTATGGICAVASTDVLQLVFLLGGASFLAYHMTTLNLEGLQVNGVRDLWEKANAKLSHLNMLTAWERITKNPTLLRQFHYTITYSSWLLSPPIITRVLMARNKNQIKSSFIGLSIIYPILMSLAFIIGMGLLLIHGKPVDYNNIFTVITVSLGNSLWAKSLILIMLLSAIMSTADSFLNSAVAIVVRDILPPLRQTPLVKERELSTIRLSAFILGILSIVLALVFVTKSPAVLLVLGQSLITMLFIPIVGIVLDIKKSEKALMASMVTFIVLFMVSILLAIYGDFSFIDPTWGTIDAVVQKYPMLLPYVVVLSIIAYLIFEAITHQGLQWEQRFAFTTKEDTLLERGFKDLQIFFDNPLAWAEDKVDRYGSRPSLFAILVIAVFLFPPILGDPILPIYEVPITILMLSVFTLCTALLVHTLWYKIPHYYYAILWLFILTYCLPFAFLLRWLYHPTLLNAFYLLFVPICMYVFVGRWTSIILSLLGYGMAYIIRMVTYGSIWISLGHYMLEITLIALAIITLMVFHLIGHHAQYSLDRLARIRIWSSSWGHDLNHLFAEAQMEASAECNPLPKDEKKRLVAYEKRMQSIRRRLETGVLQSQAFRQLIIQDCIRPSEITIMSLPKVINHVYKTLQTDYKDMVVVTGKAPTKVYIFLPIFTNILTNLIRNAYYHGNASKIEFTWDAKQPILYIKDNGHGIPKRKFDRLFDFNPTRSGSGIGLPFIHRALRAMRARIDVMSSERGTSFMILFDQPVY